jgi:precorrin-2/cobalt-factor-2 C20-methyltransferase
VLGAPLAARNDVLSVIPAPLEADELKRQLAGTDAAAVIKLGRHFAKVRGVLDELGLTQHARYVERATMAAQRILPLGEVEAEAVPYFSMILLHARGEAWRV